MARLINQHYNPIIRIPTLKDTKQAIGTTDALW